MIFGTSADRVIRVGWLAAILLAWMSVAAGQLEREGVTLDQLMARIAAAAGTSVRFREEKTLSFLESPLVSHGRLRFQAPDKLIRETGDQGGTRYAVSPTTLIVEEVGKEPREMRLDDFPALSGMIETMRALFTGDLERLHRLHQVALQTDADGWILVLEPRGQDISNFVAKIRVSGQAARIETVETLETGGDRVLMTILRDG